MLSAVCNGHDKGSGDEVVGLSLPLLPPPYRLPKGHKAATWIREEFDDLKLLTGMSFSVSPESESQQVTVTNCGLGVFKDMCFTTDTYRWLRSRGNRSRRGGTRRARQC